MKPKVAVLYVDEVNYAKLQKISPRDFPSSYEEYAKHVDQRNRQASREVVPVNVYANIDKFISWCASSKINPDDSAARAAYAGIVFSRCNLHDVSFVVDE